MDINSLINQLNAPSKEQRLDAAGKLKKKISCGVIVPAPDEGYTDNHVHTTYSFSPYSPSKAVYMAVMSGLSTVGIMDHDAINGAEEFIEAGKIMGIATTIGFEIRTDWNDTQLKGKRINNPDQLSNAYISAHGIPHQNIRKADLFLSHIRTARAKRNAQMVGNINRIVKELGISVDYEQDVLPLSMARDGGGVTERHLLFALVNKLIAKFGTGSPLILTLQSALNVVIDQKSREYLSDLHNDTYQYDLLNVLKRSFIAGIYVDTDSREAISVQQAVDFIHSIGAIPSYCYLGDVKESPTGDKMAQRFEDDYLEEVLQTAKDIGFAAIAYMPSRNTMTQLSRIMSLCEKYGFMQISGEDINQPRQSFICRQLSDSVFAHLTDTTWALVGHEMAATNDINNGMFSDRKVLSSEALNERIHNYKVIGIQG
jgi:hypothetical protein